MRGIMELIERDAFMLNYLLRIGASHVDVQEDPLLSEIESYLRKFGLKAHYINLLTDLPAFCILVIIEDLRAGIVPAPWFSAGMKCGSDARQCVIGAVEEAWHTRPWVRGLLQKRNVEPENRQTNISLTDIPSRALYWTDSSLRQEIEFLLTPRELIKLSTLARAGESFGRIQTGQLIEKLSRSGHDVYRVNLTTPEILDYGLVAAKVIIPSLQQFHLIEPYVALNGNRLRNFGSVVGLGKSSVETLNTTPHFFL